MKIKINLWRLYFHKLGLGFINSSYLNRIGPTLHVSFDIGYMLFKVPFWLLFETIESVRRYWLLQLAGFVLEWGGRSSAARLQVCGTRWWALSDPLILSNSCRRWETRCIPTPTVASATQPVVSRCSNLTLSPGTHMADPSAIPQRPFFLAPPALSQPPSLCHCRSQPVAQPRRAEVVESSAMICQKATAKAVFVTMWGMYSSWAHQQHTNVGLVPDVDPLRNPHKLWATNPQGRILVTTWWCFGVTLENFFQQGGEMSCEGRCLPGLNKFQWLCHCSTLYSAVAFVVGLGYSSASPPCHDRKTSTTVF